MPFIPVLTPQGSCLSSLLPFFLFPGSLQYQCVYLLNYEHKIVSELIYSFISLQRPNLPSRSQDLFAVTFVFRLRIYEFVKHWKGYKFRN